MRQKAARPSKPVIQRVTIRDVAEKAGVSPAAVSLTLSGRGRIADQTRQHILRTVAELNYVPPRRRRESADWRVFTVSAGSGSEAHPDRSLDLQHQVRVLRDEVDQRQQEGFDTGQIDSLVSALAQSSPTRYDIEMAWDQIENDLDMRPDYAFHEPSTWERITESRSQLTQLEARFSANQLYDRIYGGLLGRVIGCTLARPVELLGDFEDIRLFLERGGAYPLTDYVPEILPHPAGYVHYDPPVQHYLRGHIQYGPRDDDLDFTVLNLLLLEKHGGDFSSEQVAGCWLSHLAYNSTYTAERIAYTNLVNQYGPPDSALYRNPYREFIGAQIRGDMFGYTAPGQPALAAQRAWRDARISHVKNGIYGEMFISAMIAAAFVLGDIEAIIRAGLEVIPANSRMAVAVLETIEQVRRAEQWQYVAAFIGERFANHDPIHVLPNVCLVVLALLWGRGEFERTITTAAMAGLDADCNAATTGSIVGVLNGAARLPARWTAPINDRLETWVRGQASLSISELAHRALNLARGSLNTHNR